jgi:hypothetical protein
VLSRRKKIFRNNYTAAVFYILFRVPTYSRRLLEINFIFYVYYLSILLYLLTENVYPNKTNLRLTSLTLHVHYPNEQNIITIKTQQEVLGTYR